MRPLYYFVGLVCSLLIFELVFSYSDSPPPAFIGNIGEPGCDNCHGQTSCINPYSILEVWDTIALDTVPRDTFSFSIHILDSLNASFGFQFTCVDTSGQQSVGDFILIDTSSTSLDTMGLKYYTGHHNADTTRNWTVYWSPPAGYSGKVWFYWTVFVGCSDTLPPDSLPNIGAGSTTWGSFSHVFGNSVDSSVNIPPIANDDSVETLEDTPIAINVLQNDFDLDGVVMLDSFSLYDPPLGGTVVTDPGSGQMIYTPDINFTGLDFFTYYILDDSGGYSSLATVFITVVPVPDSPIAVDDGIIQTDEDVPVIVPVLINDYDPDGFLVPSSVFIVSSADNGTLSVNSITGEVTYYPNPNFNGVDSFAYVVSDNEGQQSNVGLVQILVLGVNDPPVAVDDGVFQTDEDVGIDIGILGNDYDSDGTIDSSTVVLIDSTLHGVLSVDVLSGQVSYVPDSNYSGVDSFHYYVSDNQGGISNVVLVLITVLEVNDGPVAVDDSVVTDEDVGVLIWVVGNDYDVEGGLDYSSVSVVSGVLHGDLVLSDPLSGQYWYVPDLNYVGLDSFSYVVSDDSGLVSNVAWVYIEVLGVADGPFALNDSTTLIEDGSVEILVLANDNDLDGFLDLSSITALVSPVHGSLTSNLLLGTFSYTPDADYVGLDSFYYVVYDDGGLVSNAALVYLEILAVNDPPIAECDYLVLNMGTPDTVNILANDMDIDGNVDPSSVTIVSPPSHGSAIVTADNQMVYFPPPQYIGNDTLYYSVCDDGSPVLCDTACVIVSILAIPNPPIANADSFITPENECILLDLLGNDSDPDGNITSAGISIFSQGSGGNVSWDFVIGNFVFCPEPNFSGDYFFQYQLCDNSGLCDTATGVVTVTPVIVCPSGIEDFMTILQYPHAASIEVTNNDILDSISLVSIQVIDSPQNGTEQVIDPFSGIIQYAPNPGYSGLDSLSYQLCYLEQGGCCDSNLTWLYFTIEANHPPVAVDDAYIIPQGSPSSFSVGSNDLDVDGDISISSVQIIDSTINGNILGLDNWGQVMYQPDSLFFGLDSFTYVIYDLYGNVSNVATVIITLNPVNNCPVSAEDFVITNEDNAISFDVLANDLDADGNLDLSSLFILTLPSSGNVSIDPLTTNIVYTPDTNFFGLDSFAYEVYDFGACSSGKTWVYVTVNPLDDAPIANNDTIYMFMNTDSCFSILANDVDVDNVLDNQSIILINSGALGTSTLSTINDTTFYSSFDPISQQWVTDSFDVVMNPVFCYTPDQNVIGTEVYNYVLSSGGSFSQPASIVIYIIEFNSPPVAMPDTLSISEDSPGQLAVLNNDSDAEDNIDSSLVVILTQPLTVSISVSSSGVVLVIPSLNWYGLDSFQYSVCDDGGPSLCDTSWGYILVSSVNDPPVVVIDIIEVDEDDLTSEQDIVINDYDPDGDLDLSTFELLCQTTNGVTSAPSIGDSTIHIYYNSDENFHGTDTLCYAICDYGVPVLCDTTIVVFVVNSVNDPPVAVDDYVTMMEDTLCLELDAGSNDFDIDGDSVSVISITELPSNLSATLIPLPSGEFGFEICSPQDFCGLDTFWYLIQSFGPLGSALDTAMVVVTVTCVNDPPVAVDDGIIQTDEDVGVTVPVLINDYDGDGTIDSSTVVLIDSTLHGVLSIDGLSGLVSYIPVSNYSGLDSFQYSVSDNEGLLSNIATVIINVSPVDDPPIAVDDYVTMMEDTLCLELDAESNDFDIDGDPISVISISDFPSTLTVSIAPLPSGDFGFEICSPQDFCGQDTFWYLIQSFGPLGSDVDTGMVVVTVTCVNDPPIAECDYLVLNMGTPDTVNILANDMDIDGNVDPSSVTIVSPPSHGSAIVTADSQMVYFPPPQYIGNDTLYYFVCDDGSPVLCDTACVIVSILAIPNPPIANADSFLTQENECIILDLLANDSDPDGDISPAGLSIFSQGSGGNVSWDFVIGNFVFCPEPNFSGDYFFQYQLCDNSGLCDTATGVVTVTPVIVCPSGIEDFMTILQYPYAASIEVTGNDILDSTAVFSIQVIDSPHNGIEQVIDPFSGTIQYTPNPGYSGLDSLSYQLCYLEQGGCCDSNLTWVYFTIEANHPPVAEADEFVTETDSCLFLPFLQNDDDPDGDELSWSIIDSVSNGSLTNQAGQLYYCPDSLFNGIETLEYQICDTFGGCDTALISIYVNAAIGIGEEMNFSLISFYPNPVIDFLEINIPGGRILHDLLILDVRGKQIRKVEGSFRSSFQVPFPYASGIYYLKYRQEGKEIIIRKVLKAND